MVSTDLLDSLAGSLVVWMGLSYLDEPFFPFAILDVVMSDLQEESPAVQVPRNLANGKYYHIWALATSLAESCSSQQWIYSLYLISHLGAVSMDP